MQPYQSYQSQETKKWAWYWDEVYQSAFDNVKATIAKDVALAYPDYSNQFEIYSDASSRQLGAVINRPIVFFSWKLTETQQHYSATKIELLALVETLIEFKGMLWGQSTKVYTERKNLIKMPLD